MTIDAQAKSPRTDTRQRILDVSARLFAAHGYAGTSIRDIAGELRVTKAALYYHFSSKDEILQEIVSKPIVAVSEVMALDRDVTTATARRQLVFDVIAAMASCDGDVMTVFKDPSVMPYIDTSVSTSGITHQLSVRLAMGLSAVDDPTLVRPEHLLRAIAAVAAGYEAISYWDVAYGECMPFASEDIEIITGLVADVLEGGKN